MVQEVLKDIDMDAKGRLRCKNMFALGIVSWLFDRPLEQAEHFISKRFAKKEIIRQANIAALHGGYSYGANTHAFVGTPFVIEGAPQEPGTYIDVTGNKATAFGLIAGAERAGLQLFLGSYPITPATDVLHFLAKYKSLGVITMQAEDEIAGICTAIGASYAGLLGVTSTSGPGIALKSEAINLAVIAELPLVVIDVQRGGPSTGMPTKSEQTDLLQAMYGRNGESPLVVIAPTSPSKCFDAAYQAVRIAVEHMTPVILLSDAYLGNGSVAWRIPDYEQYPEIKPPYVSQYKGEEPWMPYFRNPDNLVRYWSVPGAGSLPYRTGGLEKGKKKGADEKQFPAMSNIDLAAGNAEPAAVIADSAVGEPDVPVKSTDMPGNLSDAQSEVTTEDAQKAVDSKRDDIIVFTGGVSLSVKDGSSLSTIESDKLIYNRSENMIEAEGNVRYSRKTGGSEEAEEFTGELLLFNIDEMDKKTIDFFLLVICGNERTYAGNTLLCKVFICIRKYNPITRRLIQSKILCSTKVIYPLK